MPILNIQISQAGLTSTLPNLAYIQTNDTEATVLTTGYLNGQAALGNVFPIPCLAIVSTQASATAAPKAGTYNVTSSGGNVSLTATTEPGSVILPTTANAMAVFADVDGTLTDNIVANNVVTTSSATPGTIRSVKGVMQGTNATMSSGNLVGVRGEVDCVGASGGFLYGCQGKVIPTGTLSGSSWTAGVFGQLDISAATINAGQIAALWGDFGATSHTLTNQSGIYGIAFTNTTAAVPIGQIYLYGGATNLLYLNTNAGLSGTTYFKAAGTSSGSAGYASGCNATEVLTISVNGSTYYIPAFAQNT